MDFTDSDIYPAFEQILQTPDKVFEPCKGNPELFCYAASHNGKLLITYCFKDGRAGKAVAIFISAGVVEGLPSFNLLYSVTESLRGKGLGTRIVEESIAQFCADFDQAKITPEIPGMFITTFVDINNLVSQKLSRRFISKTPTIIKDSVSGRPQFFYKRYVKLD